MRVTKRVTKHFEHTRYQSCVSTPRSKCLANSHSVCAAVWEESTVAELPSGDDILEHGGCGDVDKNSIPTTSQEELEEMLESKEAAQQLTEDKFAHCVHNFIGIENNDEMLEHTMDVACDVPIKKELFADDTLNFVSSSKNEISTNSTNGVKSSAWVIARKISLKVKSVFAAILA